LVPVESKKVRSPNSFWPFFISVLRSRASIQPDSNAFYRTHYSAISSAFLNIEYECAGSIASCFKTVIDKGMYFLRLFNPFSKCLYSKTGCFWSGLPEQ
jgi:hypothetical protein